MTSKISIWLKNKHKIQIETNYQNYYQTEFLHATVTSSYQILSKQIHVYLSTLSADQNPVFPCRNKYMCVKCDVFN